MEAAGLAGDVQLASSYELAGLAHLPSGRAAGNPANLVRNCSSCKMAGLAGHTVLYFIAQSGWSHVTSAPSSPLKPSCHTSHSDYPLVTAETNIFRFSVDFFSPLRGTYPIRIVRMSQNFGAPSAHPLRNILSHVTSPSALRDEVQYLVVDLSSALGARLSSEVSSRVESECLSAQVQLLEMVSLAGHGVFVR